MLPNKLDHFDMPNAFSLATDLSFASRTVFLLNIILHCVLFIGLIMPMTNAEHQKKYREKLKEKHSFEDLRKKASDHRKKKRKGNLEKVRNKDRERQQRCRALKKAGKTTNSPAHKSKGTLTKAVKKVESVLPKFSKKKVKSSKGVDVFSIC